MATEEEVTRIKDQYSFHLLDLPEVSGVGVEKHESGGYALAIHLNADAPELRKRLQAEIKGVPLKFIKSGPFHKLPGKK